MRRIIILAAAIIAALAGVYPASADVKRVTSAFLYEGRTVRVEFYRPNDNVARPAALVLHGASGLGRGWFVYPFAKAMAERGMAAAVVHYYDGLGKRSRKASPRIFRTRDRILKRAIDFVLAQPHVLDDGLGIYGMSLGGFHALSLGTQDDRVRAVVSLGGGLSRHIPEREAGRLPPTLLLHGDRDRVVPLKRALSVSRAMETYGAPGEIKIYRGEGHSLSQRAHADAIRSTSDFLVSILLSRNLASAQ